MMRSFFFKNVLTMFVNFIEVVFKNNINNFLRFALVFIASSLFFVLLPQIDISISTIFFEKEKHFPANDFWFIRFIYEGTPWLSRLFFFGALLIILCAIFFPAKISRRNWRRASAFLAVLILGAGILTHLILKDGVGRPRPRDLHIFGGTTAYVPVFKVSEFCASNCSFVSGHASAGFSLMAIGIFGIRRKRQYWLMVASLIGGFIGAARIAQGAHFLSDIVFSFLSIWFCCLIVRSIWIRFRYWQLSKMFVSDLT